MKWLSTATQMVHQASLQAAQANLALAATKRRVLTANGLVNRGRVTTQVLQLDMKHSPYSKNPRRVGTLCHLRHTSWTSTTHAGEACVCGARHTVLRVLLLQQG